MEENYAYILFLAMEVTLQNECCFLHQFFNNKYITFTSTRSAELKFETSINYSFHLLSQCEKAL